MVIMSTNLTTPEHFVPAPSQGVSVPLPKAKQRPQRYNLVLRNQAGLRRRNPPWNLVERVIREIDTGCGNSHCCLETPGNTYIQTLHGFNGYHLEWRISGTAEYTHYRGCYPGGSTKRAELKKHDYVNSGEHRDLLHLDEVIDAFRAFYCGEGLPAWLEWRILDI